jgi:transglutaminase-like putative cysteine protease
MKFEKFFRLISYAAVFCGFLALWVSGTFGVVASGIFITVILGAWFLEGSRWQISERVGTALIVLALPLFYLGYRTNVIAIDGGDAVLPGVLARMILSLAAVKLLQRKSNRDWIFLYLMSFFEVLLAAGLSISALYLASFILYLLVMVCAVIAFEIRKTAFSVEQNITGEKPAKRDTTSEAKTAFPVRRLPATAIALIVFIVALAMPLFFMLPRVGGAGFGGNQGGSPISSGFSDTVKLGGIGRIQQNDEVVMRVKLDPPAGATGELYFRGIALDTFDNQSWSRSKTGAPNPFIRGEGDLFRIDSPGSARNISSQTYYLEPLNTAVIFALHRALEVQGSFPTIYRDAYGSLSHRRNYERISYSVFSDLSTPSAEKLRADDVPYTVDVQNYRSLPPRFDQRIAELASRITTNSNNRYDKARAIESYLQRNFGYTLEQKAGGQEPLANFLFDVREGHCEYFATAMAVMLRTQGVATRIVNGFHGGEYNDAVDMTVVRNRNAHSWVEVYFPGENAWITFDPTPASGDGNAASTGIAGAMNKYLEALETLWIQYFVAYDNQEQRTLAREVRGGFLDYQQKLATFLGHTQGVLAEWLADIRGDKGFEARRSAVGYAVAYIAGFVVIVFLLVWLTRKTRRLGLLDAIWKRFFKKKHASVVEFYERMQRILAEKGLVRESHQTPLEFAYAVGMTEVVAITERYNRVRFGYIDLSTAETSDIEEYLKKIEAADRRK